MFFDLATISFYYYYWLSFVAHLVFFTIPDPSGGVSNVGLSGVEQ